MESESSPSSNNNDSDEGQYIVDEHSESKPNPGNVIWVKRSGGFWWPAMVVEENNVSENNKPDIKLMGDVLVRLYGSYEYLYVDHVKCHSELQAIKQSNGESYVEILKKSMEQYISLKISDIRKEQGSKSRDGRVGASKAKKTNPNRGNWGRGNLKNNNEEVGSKTPQQNGAKKKLKFDSPNADENSKRKTLKQDGSQKNLKPIETTSQSSKKHELDTPHMDLRTRKLKVMQTLGLSAPSGSPFLRNGCSK